MNIDPWFLNIIPFYKIISISLPLTNINYISLSYDINNYKLDYKKK